MGNGAVGVPDVIQLPIQSPERQYNLQNTATALSPQATAPPGAIGPPALGSIEDLQQRSLQSFQKSGTYIPPVPQDFLQAQFQQPDQNDPLEGAKQTILARLQDRQQQNMQRGSRIKNLLTDFLGGAGRGMMVHAGLPTPEMEHQRDQEETAKLEKERAEAPVLPNSWNAREQLILTRLEKNVKAGKDGGALSAKLLGSHKSLNLWEPEYKQGIIILNAPTDESFGSKTLPERDE